MVKRYLSVSHQELTRQKVKFALHLKVKPSIIAQKAKITERTVKSIKRRKGIKRVKGSGRKTILSQNDKLRIKHRLKQNPFISLCDLVVELDLICTARTVRNYLCSLGFKSGMLKVKDGISSFLSRFSVRDTQYYPYFSVKKKQPYKIFVFPVKNHPWFKWRKPELKPPLTDQDKRERFQWCERNKNSLSWNKVIF